MLREAATEADDSAAGAEDEMLKDPDQDAAAESRRRCRSTGDARSPDGQVYCFVGTAELRRLLSLLAGIELLGDLVRSVGRGREVRGPAPDIGGSA